VTKLEVTTMDEFDEPDMEPEGIEGRPGLTLVGLTLADVQTCITAAVTQWTNGASVREVAEKEVRRLVAEAVEALVRTQVEVMVTEAIQQLLAEGFDQYDEYGSKRGHKSLRDLVHERLTQRDRYGNHDSKLNETIARAVEQALAKEFRPIIDEAKAALRARFDEVITVTVAKAVREASGLRT